ncbi:MAG: hypothetical protein ACI36V_02760 [Coriobacteriales bacterium]
MRTPRCSIDDLDVVLEEEVLEPFRAEACEAVAKGIDDTARQMVRETKATAPRSDLDRSGTFAKHIAWKGEDTGPGSHRATWYVRSPEHRLTHLLVHGHATPDGGRTRGNRFLHDAVDNADVVANIKRRMGP